MLAKFGRCCCGVGVNEKQRSTQNLYHKQTHNHVGARTATSEHARAAAAFHSSLQRGMDTNVLHGESERGGCEQQRLDDRRQNALSRDEMTWKCLPYIPLSVTINIPLGQCLTMERHMEVQITASPGVRLTTTATAQGLQ
jgi:hypothetical protein